MEKAYKFRIYPTALQRATIKRTFGCVRFVYNHYIDLRRELYQRGEPQPSYIDMVKNLNDLKQQYLWLKKVDSRALQNTLKDLDAAYRRFFSRTFNSAVGKGFPHYKSKNNLEQRYKTTCNSNSIEYLGDFIKLPKLGKVRLRGGMPIQGRILNATVILQADGNYYVSICCTDVMVEKLPFTGKRVRVEYGDTNCFIKLFEPVENNARLFLRDIPFKENLICSLEKHRHLMKRLSRAKDDSRGKCKLLNQQRRLRFRIECQQRAFLQELANSLVREYDVIDIGNIPSRMDDESGLMYARWSQFKAMIKYKLEWYKSVP